MPKVKLSPELKEAISYLSSTEKDKLLFRLLAKEPLLVEQLIVKLIEGGASTEFRRDELRKDLIEQIDFRPFFSSSSLMYDLGEYSSKITFHTRATKDKLGEIELNLLILIKVLSKHKLELKNVSAKKINSLVKYVLRRSLKLIDLINKLHEDYRMEFEDDLRDLAMLIGELPVLMNAAIFIGFDVNCLVNFEIDMDTKPHRDYIKFL
ncbi:MAG: hypothetical protein ACPGSD_06240 [Flavobacteriales bacterium]